MCQRRSHFIILLNSKGTIANSSGLYPNNDLGAFHHMTAGDTLGIHPLILIRYKH